MPSSIGTRSTTGGGRPLRVARLVGGARADARVGRGAIAQRGALLAGGRKRSDRKPTRARSRKRRIPTRQACNATAPTPRVHKNGIRIDREKRRGNRTE